jgi:uncharacterized protein
MPTDYLLLAAAFFGIALLYSSVGFGGGSSYLAIMTILLPGSMALIKTTGLLCNLVVAGGGALIYLRRKDFDRRKSWLLIVTGILAAFLGGMIRLREHTFFVTLGAVLVLSGLLLIVPGRKPLSERPPRALPRAAEAGLGGAIGFLAGLVSIGGGILLSPVLNLLRWDRPRSIAALASVFIFLNSVAVLSAQAVDGTFTFDPQLSVVLLLAVTIGGQLGTRLSLRYIRPQAVKLLTGVLVSYIGIKLVLKHTIGIDI